MRPTPWKKKYSPTTLLYIGPQITLALSSLKNKDKIFSDASHSRAVV